jgi:uncharacterized membrane protein
MVRKGLLFSIPLLLLVAAFSVMGWIMVPQGQEIPVHWSASGDVNRTAGHVEAFLLTPGIALLLTLVFAVAPSIDPRGRNLQRSQPLWLAAWLGSLLILAVAQGVISLSAIGVIDAGTALMPKLIGSVVAAFFMVIGNLLGKARPNWFAGIRTPWSLSSDRSWDVTHRWAGRLFMAAGLASLVAIWSLHEPYAWIAMLAAILIATLASIVLSYLVWKKDPERETYSADPGE